jgi:hypothetical protein
MIGDSLNKQDKIYFTKFEFLDNQSEDLKIIVYPYKELEKEEDEQVPKSTSEVKNYLNLEGV